MTDFSFVGKTGTKAQIQTIDGAFHANSIDLDFPPVCISISADRALATAKYELIESIKRGDESAFYDEGPAFENAAVDTPGEAPGLSWVDDATVAAREPMGAGEAVRESVLWWKGKSIAVALVSAHRTV